MSKSDMVTITREEYEGLMNDSIMLCALEGAGVDNWQGYDDAMESYREMKDEQE